ncbi:Fur family transcriptional regulator [Aeoliella mucimassa]|uniref:Ferric uptake regulation protein n=1 Tax=Aeoliella mucimassa TaxID=2527972 RepID=A0A518AMP8_9BACT|nr:Fur family transcriptional regulator [Aeoliella mucimassa]QDU55983.1 Ferric uptake regulation protein [Aeoliella mucimassa]
MSKEYALESIEVSLSPRERFVEYLQSRGKRVTQQRMQLVDRIFERHEHFDADELIAHLSQNKETRISRATIYRTLDELVDAGMLRAMSLSGRRVYEHDYGYPQHDHLHCKSCDSLIEFASDELVTLRDAVAREHGFRVTGHRLIITGICAPCQKKQSRPASPLDLV